MRASVNTFRAHKDGNVPHQYEDASVFLPEPDDQDGDVQAERFSVAVSDGASESLLAGLWARELARLFAEADREVVLAGPAFAAAAAAACGVWDEAASCYVSEREAARRPIRWYEEPGLARGAYATLLAARFEQEAFDQVSWSAAALGDACLFQVRGDELITAFPLSSGAEFGVRPDLLNSRRADQALIADRVKLASGKCEQEDRFYLCTDALAAWFLTRSAADERPWADLQDLGTEALPSFDDWVAAKRAEGMHNDDVTLVRIDFW